MAAQAVAAAVAELAALALAARAQALEAVARVEQERLEVSAALVQAAQGPEVLVVAGLVAGGVVPPADLAGTDVPRWSTSLIAASRDWRRR